MVKVTVVVAIYNVEKYLKKCIRSIISQTYKNLEIILVNDGSNDNSLEICRSYEKKDSRIRVIDQPNQGVSAARNNGIEAASGEYIMFVDGDDFLRKNIVESLIENVGDNDIIICAYTAFEETKEFRKKCRFYKGDRDFSDSKKDLYLQLINTSYGQTGQFYTAVGVPWGKLYRKKFLDENGLTFNKELVRMQDNIFNMNAFALADRIRYIDKPLYMYRLSNILNYKKLPCKPEYLLLVLEERKKIITEFGLDNDKQIRDAFSEEVVMDAIKTVIYVARTEDYRNFKRKAKSYLRNDIYKKYCKKGMFVSKRAFVIGVYMKLGLNRLTYTIARYIKF